MAFGVSVHKGGFVIYSAHSTSECMCRVEMAGKKLAGVILGARSRRAKHWCGLNGGFCWAGPIKSAQTTGVCLGVK